MKKSKVSNREEVQRLKEELRKEVLQEIEATQLKEALTKKENAFKEELRSENRGHLMKLFFLASGLLLSWPIQYFFPDLDFRIGMTIGILIGATIWLLSFIIRNYRLGHVLKAYPIRSAITFLVLCCALTAIGTWTVSGRPARLIVVSKRNFVDGQNLFKRVIGDDTLYDVEADGSLGIRCYERDSCSHYAKWLGKESAQYTLHDSIVKAGFDRVVLHEVVGDVKPPTENRVEIKLK